MKYLLLVMQSVVLVLVLVTPSELVAQDTSYLDPPQIVSNPASLSAYAATNRQFTGIPSLAISQTGRMWATWYAGITPEEDPNNYVVVATSGDNGANWEEVLVIDPDGSGPARSYDPEVWIDPNGMLWVFWAQASPTGKTWGLITEGTRAGVWAITKDNPDSNEEEWSKPRRLIDGVMMCKPTVSSTGEWYLPASLWKLSDGSAQIVVSGDDGKTWRKRGAVDVPVDVRSYDENIIVEKMDKSLWMLLRTQYGIGESVSTDNGVSWSVLTPSRIKHPSARFFIRRLNSGNLLLVKHGVIEEQTDRSQLMAFVSEDDGESWSKGLMLDERVGVSYPDGQQEENGTINIIYDYQRRDDQNILIASFREEDVISGNSESETVILRRPVSKGGTQGIKDK